MQADQVLRQPCAQHHIWRAGTKGPRPDLTATLLQALTRGIIANWLVNLAIWIGTSSSSVPGKIIGAIVPVTAFTAMGMEHSGQLLVLACP